MSLKLRAFEQCYKENESKIKMPKGRNYPINYKIGIKWATSHCDIESARFAGDIIKHTAYVSFDDFLKQLEIVCRAFIHYYKKIDAKYILIIPYTLNKSNFWVSLLAFPMLREIITDVECNVTDAYNNHFINGKNKRVVCIVCDDCSYTGNQIMTYCSFEAQYLKYENKPKEPDQTKIEWVDWLNDITEHVNGIQKTLDKDKFSVNLIVPYISTMAQQIISGYHYILVARDAKIFKLFRQHINVHEYNQGVMREFGSSFQYHPDVSAIYFDHKIADAVSTFNKIYLLAPVFNCGSLRKSICFIDGCCGEKDIDESIDIYGVYINIEDHLDGKACPPTFYKSIVYTYNNKPIADIHKKCLCDIDGSSKQKIRI